MEASARDKKREGESQHHQHYLFHNPKVLSCIVFLLGAPCRGACLPQSRLHKAIAVPGIRDSLSGAFQYFVFIK
jgi:hypothetical protein